MKLQLKGRRFDRTEEIHAESQEVVGYCRVEYNELQHSNSNNIYYASYPCTVSYNW
jgi:hypothetical protein